MIPHRTADLPRPRVAMATHGMVASSQLLASQVGLRVLQDGGNAVDAAIAAAAVLVVVEPDCSHLGGDAFALIYDAARRKVTAINGSGAAPRAASRSAFIAGIPERGIRAASVPGIVDAWHTALARFGTMTLSQVLSPAIRYATTGIPVTHGLHRTIAGAHDLLTRFPAAARAYLKDGRPPAPGELLVQEDLGRTLQAIAEGGRDAFYEGEIAAAILRFSEESGGLFSQEDFALHRSQLLDSITTTYRGYTVFEQPPVSQGHILLEELNIVEKFDLVALGPGTAEAIHLLIEAKKLAFADRMKYMGDPAFVETPLAGVLSKEYARERARQIDMGRANPSPSAGDPARYGHDTTYLAAVDSQGNMVSFIQSLFAGFGCGVVAGDTGVLLNNRMRGFSLEEGHPNSLAPGKRTVHTLNTYLLFKGGRPFMVGGTPGGDIQVQTNLQVITNLVDFGMNVQEAIEAPRWASHVGNQVTLEVRIPAGVRRALAARGHQIAVVGGWEGSGRAQAIVVHPETGVLMGGSDPRCEGCAVGW